MIQLKKREFGKIVNKLKRGFEIKERHTGDWQIRLWYQGRLIGGTKCSEGRGNIFPIITQKIRKQLYFRNDEELSNFKNCPLTCTDYIKLLKERNII